MHQRTLPIRARKHLGAYSVQLNDASATMAETQYATLNDVKTIGECNQSMMESMMTILQSIQTQNLKIEREVRSLRSDMTKMADGRHSGETLEGLKAITELQAVTLEDVKVNTEQQVTELSTVKDIIEKVLPQKVKDIMTEELKEAEPLRYRVRSDFNCDHNYGIYVKQHIRRGMKVMYCSDDGWRGLAVGDVGTVVQRLLTSSNNVSVDWSGHFFPKNKNVCFYDVELLG